MKDLVFTWIFTFPGCGLLGFGMAKLFFIDFCVRRMKRWQGIRKTTIILNCWNSRFPASVEASNLLEKIFCEFDPRNIAAYMEQMHAIEHAADDIHHDILTKLSVEFITPIDQEDILRLVQIIDDITDALDEVIMEFYMFHIDQVPEKAAELSKIVNRCVSALYEAAGELKNFKKPHALRSLLIKVN